MFSSRIGWKSLAVVCRSLATLLESGVDVRKAFVLAAGKSLDGNCRKAMGGVAEAVRRGVDVTSAMQAQGDAFPPLMIDMVGVAEQAGALPEVLTGLADHYENNVRLRKNFLYQIAWPVFQLFAAIFVIALLLLLLGWIAEMNRGVALDVFGFGAGFTGTRGAALWLGGCFGTMFGLFALYMFVTKAFAGKQILDPLLLKLPVIGTCLRSFAIARFSWAFALTQQAGMPLERSLDASLAATGNGAFVGRGRYLRERVRDGALLHEAFTDCELFPPDYLEMVHVAETAGTVPEMLQRMGPQFEDQARRSLSMMAAMLGWLVWLTVAAFIVFLIIRFILWYVALLQSFL